MKYHQSITAGGIFIPNFIVVTLQRNEKQTRRQPLGVLFMPKREYGIKLCAAGDTDDNGCSKSDTLKMERSRKMNRLPMNLQLFADGGAGSAAAGDQGTGGQTQSQQATPPAGQHPAIDYARIQQMLEGTLAAKEDTALKAYFKQQGLSQQEAEQAIAAFKQQKAANQPDVSALQGQVTEAQNQAAAAQARAREAQLESAAMMAAVTLGIDAKTIPYVLKMADLSQAMGQDGKIDEEALKTALNKVLEDVPALKPQAPGTAGFVQIGAAGSPGQQAQQATQTQQAAVPAKRWNRFNN